MKLFLVLAFAVGLTAAVPAENDVYVSEDLEDSLDAPRPIKDRFRIVQTNLTDTKLQTEIDDFTSYRCEHMVVIKNEASNWFRLWCSSHDDKLREIHVSKGQSFAFTFKPRADGKSQYRCVLDYMTKWASFEVYSEEEWYTCSRDNELIHRYYVRHDGVYANKHKIRALFKGHDEYTLWESYDNVTEETDGLLMSGFVDGGMCSDVPREMNDRSSAVTVCDHQCVILYEHYKCRGKSRKIQAEAGCTDFPLLELNKKLSAVKGC